MGRLSVLLVYERLAASKRSRVALAPDLDGASACAGEQGAKATLLRLVS